MPHRACMHTICIAVLGVASVQAAADSISIVDLTGGPGSFGFINQARFEFGALQPAGTGTYLPFVRIQMNGQERGYNTSGDPLPFDEKKGPWTHDLRLNEVPIVNLDEINYLAFELDINESGSANDRLLSLDDIQIYTSPTGSQTTTNISSLGTLRYHMDAGEDSFVLMDYRLASGSGEADMRTLIPLSNFAGAQPTDFLYFYSRFGENERSTAGFEEWRVVVPEPGSLLLLSMAAVAVLLRRRTT